MCVCVCVSTDSLTCVSAAIPARTVQRALPAHAAARVAFDQIVFPRFSWTLFSVRSRSLGSSPQPSDWPAFLGPAGVFMKPESYYAPRVSAATTNWGSAQGRGQCGVEGFLCVCVGAAGHF